MIQCRFLNIERKAYLFALAATFGTIIVLWLLRRLVVKYFSRRANESAHDGYDFMPAVQSILSDLFASRTIILDKPFVPGDFIIVGNCMGTVEYIGLKTTRGKKL